MQGYERDPRSIALRAEQYLKLLVLAILLTLAQSQSFSYLTISNGVST